MFDLVLHHRYVNVEPHDLSGNSNCGYGTVSRGPGTEGAQTAAVFDGVGDRIYVPPSPSLTRPGGIRVDLVVNLEAFEQRRTLIEGYLSFAFGVEEDGSLGASVYRNLEWAGVQSIPGLVPLNTWVHVSFVYTDDGVMTLTLDGTVVAERYWRMGRADGAGWPFGVSIGAWPDGDKRLWKGRMEEVMFWRAA
ncbi:LamG-like jellyroll fold domain-containing protein [Parafrankia sp. FMc6]|uniref:LamG-like jellyroll fold domain-containing protein n=1 Tax=Parafrankia soli TaxID=2599596 RepID=UPI0034D43A8E